MSCTCNDKHGRFTSLGQEYGTPRMRLEEIGLIGNGQFAAHVARNGSVVWCRVPRLDLGHDAFEASPARKDVL